MLEPGTNPVQEMLLKGEWGTDCAASVPLPHPGQEPHHHSPPFTPGASQEPPLSMQMQSQGHSYGTPAAARIQRSKESRDGEKGKRAAGPSRAVPAVVAMSCGAELRHPSCEGITRNVSTGICFPHPLLEERRARPPASAVPTPQNTPTGGHGQGGGFYGAPPVFPFPCACRGHRGQGLGSRHSRARLGEGSSFTGRYNRKGAGALLRAQLGSTLSRELKACSGTSSPPACKRPGSRRGSPGALGWELWLLGKGQK